MHLGVAFHLAEIEESAWFLVANERVQSYRYYVVGQSRTQHEHHRLCVEFEALEIKGAVVLIQTQRPGLEILFMVHDQGQVHEHQHAGSDEQNGVGDVAKDGSAVGEVVSSVCNEQVDGGVSEHKDNIVQFDKHLQDVTEITFDAFYLEILCLFLVE